MPCRFLLTPDICRFDIRCQGLVECYNTPRNIIAFGEPYALCHRPVRSPEVMKILVVQEMIITSQMSSLMSCMWVPKSAGSTHAARAFLASGFLLSPQGNRARSPARGFPC